MRVEYTLSQRQMDKLIDGYQPYKPGDVCILCGDVPSENRKNPVFDLVVNGNVEAGWVDWDYMPLWLRDNLYRENIKRASKENAARAHRTVGRTIGKNARKERVIIDGIAWRTMANTNSPRRKVKVVHAE